VLDLNDFRFFVEVVDRGGISSAARSLDRPVSTMSHRMQQLEAGLGISLLTRTSRRIALTEAGETFYGHAVAMLQCASEAEMAMHERLNEPIGTVRYTVAVATAQFAMTEMTLSFLRRFPQITLVQHAGDTSVDIVADRYDLAIRAHSGPLPDSTLVQRPLADAPWHLFASPQYLETAGHITTPDHLTCHSTLFMKRDNVDAVWNLRLETDKTQTLKIQLDPRMTGACMVTLKKFAEEDMGIVALPAYICRDEVAAGRLVRVLPDWVAADSTISALMPSRRGMTAATRAFLDHIAAAFPDAVRLPIVPPLHQHRLGELRDEMVQEHTNRG
jgi:DNA-binding transcriptional LysR family regulator